MPLLKVIEKILIVSLFLGVSFPVVYSEILQREPDIELGTCSVLLAEDVNFEDDLEKHRKIEKECEVYDNKKLECGKQRKCTWVPEPKVCEPKGTNESEEEAAFCTAKDSEEACLQHRARCAWGYKAPVCNAKDRNNEDHVEFCEAYDSDEDSCEKNSDKCDWD